MAARRRPASTELKRRVQAHAAASEADEVRLRGEVQGMVAQAEMDLLRVQNPDLLHHFYAPTDLPIFHECDTHKLKNLGQGLQRQTDDSNFPCRLALLRAAAETGSRHTGALGFCRAASTSSSRTATRRFSWTRRSNKGSSRKVITPKL